MRLSSRSSPHSLSNFALVDRKDSRALYIVLYVSPCIRFLRSLIEMESALVPKY